MSGASAAVTRRHYTCQLISWHGDRLFKDLRRQKIAEKRSKGEAPRAEPAKNKNPIGQPA